MTTVTSRSTPLPSPLPNGTSVDLEPDKAWKDALRAKIKNGMSSMVEDANKNLQTELNQGPVTAERHEALNQEYNRTMHDIRALASETFAVELERERQERRWAAGVGMTPEWNGALVQEQQDIWNGIKGVQKDAQSPTAAEPPAGPSTDVNGHGSAPPENLSVQIDSDAAARELAKERRQRSIRGLERLERQDALELLSPPPVRPITARKGSFHERAVDPSFIRSIDHPSGPSSASDRPTTRSPPNSSFPSQHQIWKPSSMEDDTVPRPLSAGIGRRNSVTSIKSTGSTGLRPSIAEEPIPEWSDGEAEYSKQHARFAELGDNHSSTISMPREREKRREHRKSSASDKPRSDDFAPAYTSSRTSYRPEDIKPVPRDVYDRDQPYVSLRAHRSEEISPRVPSSARPLRREASFHDEYSDAQSYTPSRPVRARPSFEERPSVSYSKPPLQGRVPSRPSSTLNEDRDYYDQGSSYRSYPTPPGSASRSSGREPPISRYPSTRTEPPSSYTYGAEPRSNTFKYAEQSESPSTRRLSESRPSLIQPRSIHGPPLPPGSYSRTYERAASASIPITSRQHRPSYGQEEAEGWKSWTADSHMPRREPRRDSERQDRYNKVDDSQGQESEYAGRGGRDYELWHPCSQSPPYYGPHPEPPRRESTHPVRSPMASHPSSYHDAPNHSFGGRERAYERDVDSDEYIEDMNTDLETALRYREAVRQRRDDMQRSDEDRRWGAEERRWLREEEIDRMKVEEERHRSMLDEERREAKLRKEAKRQAAEAARLVEETREREQQEARKIKEKEEEIRRQQIMTMKKAEELRRKEEEAKRKEEEVRREMEEAKRKEEEARGKEEEARRKEEEARRKEEEARRKEEEVKRKEEEAKREMEEAKKKEEETRKKEEQVKRQREEVKRKEVAAREEARRVREETWAKEQEMIHREEELRKREEELHRREKEIAEQKEAERLKEQEESRREAEKLQRQFDEERFFEEQKKMEEKLRYDQQQEEFRRREQEIQERKRQDSTGSSYASFAYSANTPTPRSHPPSSTANGPTSGWSSASKTSSAAKPRSGSMNSTFPTSTSSAHPPASSHDENEWKRRLDEQFQQQQERFRKEQQRFEESRQRADSNKLTKENVASTLERHERQWTALLSTTSANLRWESIPWPMFNSPKYPDDITIAAVAAYMESPLLPEKEKAKLPKDRIKEQIRKWHPDRFETKCLPRVVEEEREKVKEGTGTVIRSLNELLMRVNTPRLFD
ncbi:hypothetical protein H0H87_005676 [Tephrocybe sp. NHM501043]|nr:hypothetical protein H0H87_005676 [Tephrocybe sp. NHM501043]